MYWYVLWYVLFLDVKKADFSLKLQDCAPLDAYNAYRMCTMQIWCKLTWDYILKQTMEYFRNGLSSWHSVWHEIEMSLGRFPLVAIIEIFGIGMYWYAIHTSTCTYIPIHTRAQTYTAPYLLSARPVSALMGQLYFLYALSAVGNTAPESGRPKEARLRAATQNVAFLWSIGPESMKVPVGGLPVLAHGPWATRSWCQQCDTYIRGPKGTSDRLERTQRPALRSQVAKVCIITYL